MMNELEDLLSTDSQRIWAACGAIKSLRDNATLQFLSSHIEQIKTATSGVDLGGALCPNKYHLEFAIKKLEYFKNKQGCLCGLYPENMFFDPSKEQKKGFVEITDKKLIDGKWVDYYICQCKLCSTKFKVEEREGHYSWWQWVKV